MSGYDIRKVSIFGGVADYRVEYVGSFAQYGRSVHCRPYRGQRIYGCLCDRRGHIQHILLGVRLPANLCQRIYGPSIRSRQCRPCHKHPDMAGCRIVDRIRYRHFMPRLHSWICSPCLSTAGVCRRRYRDIMEYEYGCCLHFCSL